MTVGGISLLLGSDLENTTSLTDGWHQVVNVLRARPPAQVVKVPHHGSVSAHHDAMWDELAVARPIAVLTPFARGNVTLPTDDDVARIIGRTDRGFASCPPNRLRVRHPNKVVAKLLDDITTSPLVAQAASGGVIRLSCDLEANGEWDVELRRGAIGLSDLRAKQRRATA